MRSDEALQEKLRAATDAYTDDATDQKAIFEAIVVPLAEEAGLPFTYEEAQELASGSEKLSLDDLDAAAGGITGVCGAIGFGDGAAGCELPEIMGGIACKRIGVGGLAS